jgi:hypothetical protein
MQAMTWHSHDGNVLHVEGKILDTVHKLGPLPYFTPVAGIFEKQPAYCGCESQENGFKIVKPCRNRPWLFDG